MRQKVNIGIFKPDGTPIGYKADTFWSLTENQSEAKAHSLDENGNIPAHIIDNLAHLLRGDGTSLFVTIREIGTQTLDIMRGTYVGYRVGDGEVRFTHTIDDNLVICGWNLFSKKNLPPTTGK